MEKAEMEEKWRSKEEELKEAVLEEGEETSLRHSCELAKLKLKNQERETHLEREVSKTKERLAQDALRQRQLCCLRFLGSVRIQRQRHRLGSRLLRTWQASKNRSVSKALRIMEIRMMEDGNTSCRHLAMMRMRSVLEGEEVVRGRLRCVMREWRWNQASRMKSPEEVEARHALEIKEMARGYQRRLGENVMQLMEKVRAHQLHKSHSAVLRGWKRAVVQAWVLRVRKKGDLIQLEVMSQLHNRYEEKANDAISYFKTEMSTSMKVELGLAKLLASRKMEDFRTEERKKKMMLTAELMSLVNKTKDREAADIEESQSEILALSLEYEEERGNILQKARSDQEETKERLRNEYNESLLEIEKRYHEAMSLEKHYVTVEEELASTTRAASKAFKALRAAGDEKTILELKLKATRRYASMRQLGTILRAESKHMAYMMIREWVLKQKGEKANFESSEFSKAANNLGWAHANEVHACSILGLNCLQRSMENLKIDIVLSMWRTNQIASNALEADLERETERQSLLHISSLFQERTAMLESIMSRRISRVLSTIQSAVIYRLLRQWQQTANRQRNVLQQRLAEMSIKTSKMLIGKTRRASALHVLRRAVLPISTLACQALFTWKGSLIKDKYALAEEDIYEQCYNTVTEAGACLKRDSMARGLRWVLCIARYNVLQMLRNATAEWRGKVVRDYRHLLAQASRALIEGVNRVSHLRDGKTYGLKTLMRILKVKDAYLAQRVVRNWYFRASIAKAVSTKLPIEPIEFSSPLATPNPIANSRLLSPWRSCEPSLAPSPSPVQLHTWGPASPTITNA